MGWVRSCDLFYTIVPPDGNHGNSISGVLAACTSLSYNWEDCMMSSIWKALCGGLYMEGFLWWALYRRLCMVGFMESFAWGFVWKPLHGVLYIVSFAWGALYGRLC